MATNTSKQYGVVRPFPSDTSRSMISSQQIKPSYSASLSTVVVRILRINVQQQGRFQHFVATVFGKLDETLPDITTGTQEPGFNEICWTSALGAPPVQAGQLVQLQYRRYWPSFNDDGTTIASSVNALEVVDPDLNLLQTVPPLWLASSEKGVDWVQAFGELWARLSRPMRSWFNAIFWDEPWRLLGFLSAPGSMQHHHARAHGLFIHSVDCAQRVLRQAQGDRLVDEDVLLMAALLHDLGKAGEYTWLAQQRKWQLSARGSLQGHRLTTLEWMSAARQRLPALDRPPEDRVLAVNHAIHACHAPDWVGLRSPRTPEAFYLGSVDSLSGYCDLIASHWDKYGQQGRYLPALRAGVFVGVEGSELTGSARCGYRSLAPAKN